MSSAKVRVVFEIQIKAGGVSAAGRKIAAAWAAASTSGYCEKLFRDGGWPPVFGSKRDAIAVSDLIREASPNILAARVVARRHPANRTLWPKPNRLLDTIESLTTDALEGWSRAVREEFARHAIPLLDGALDAMRGILGGRTES